MKKVTEGTNVGGRPSKFTPELADEICARILSGLSLKKVCDADDMPHRDTVHSWLAKDSIFSDKYVRACHIRRENRFDDLDEVVDRYDDVNRARLKVDVIKWQLSKEEPKKYGNNLDVTTNGKDIPTPLFGGMSVADSSDPTDV